jgi:hypothetical protein
MLSHINRAAPTWANSKRVKHQWPIQIMNRLTQSRERALFQISITHLVFLRKRTHIIGQILNNSSNSSRNPLQVQWGRAPLWCISKRPHRMLIHSLYKRRPRATCWLWTMKGQPRRETPTMESQGQRELYRTTVGSNLDHRPQEACSSPQSKELPLTWWEEVGLHSTYLLRISARISSS